MAAAAGGPAVREIGVWVQSRAARPMENLRTFDTSMVRLVREQYDQKRASTCRSRYTSSTSPAHQWRRRCRRDTAAATFHELPLSAGAIRTGGKQVILGMSIGE